MKHTHLFLVIALWLANFSYSQSQFCGFDTERSRLRQDPSYVALEKAAEQRIKEAIERGNTTSRNTSVLTIPVVVHVLHLGEAVGTGSNISDAQIQSSIDNLNDFYRGRTTNSPVDFEMEFALAQRAPDCSATTGINRIDASGLTGYSDYGVNVNNSNGASYSDIVALSSWPQTDYFNVWIVTELDGNNGGSGFQGYAYFYNDTGNHGSVMMSSVFGYDPGNTNGWGLNSNGDNSTVVHEIGHYFHLYHTFQGDDANGDGVSDRCPNDTGVGDQSDGCADTETHQRETSTCPTQNSCTNANWVDNNTVNNIMSYYNCTDRLTNDQKTRVRAAMEGTSIVSSRGATAPDPNYAVPVAVCTTNTVTTYASGITSVALNGITFTSGSSATDGGNIDKTANCSSYFEIDTNNANTINVGMYPVNWQQLGIWIDWNNDGDFGGDAEQQYLSGDIQEETTVQHQLTYPATIPYGSYVRVRLITDIDDRYTGATAIDSACFTSLLRGQSEDYTIYVKPVTWTGATDTDWATAGNWNTNVVPTASNNVTIPSGGNQPIISESTGASVNNLTVASGASLTITGGGSLKVSGTSSGDITYNVNIADTNWYLVSSPVIGEQYDDVWVGANSIASGSGNNRGISTYDNGTPDATTSYWRYFQAGGAATTFGAGVGYAMLRTGTGTYSFTGTYPTADTSPTISQNDTNWNLLGNPYPSYLDVSEFIAANTSNFPGSFQAIYVWDGTSYNSLTTGYLNPGQGFFANSNVASGTAAITEAMQEHEIRSTGRTNNTHPSVQITLSDDTDSKNTQINYLDGKTLGLDPGFDIGMFDGVSSSLSLYTHIIEENEGIAFEIQALPDSDYESMIVPLGVKADAGKEITFSVEALNLPTVLKAFLEDKETNTFTRLDETGTEYTVTLSEELNGVGRFYLHTSSQVLGVSNVDLVSVSIYSADQKIHFSELPEGNTLLTLYDVLGKVILEEKITESTNSVSIDNISKGGVYLVRLNTEKGMISKKMVLQ